MKSKSIKIVLLGAVLTSMLSCCGDSWFERDPKNILTNELVWNDPNMIKSQLANLYNRIPQLHGDFNTGGMCETDDAMSVSYTHLDAVHHRHHNVADYNIGDTAKSLLLTFFSVVGRDYLKRCLLYTSRTITHEYCQ